MDQYILFFLLFFTLCGSDVSCERQLLSQKEDDGKIVGGTETTIQEYPYQAYLLLFNGTVNFQCGGSIVSQYHIVTAAHCLEDILSITVRIGSAYSNRGGNTYQTVTFNSHPWYDSSTSDYDVAVVRVPEGMVLDGTNATTISMVGLDSDVPEGSNVTVTGWGTTTEGGSTSEILRTVTVPAVERSYCNERIMALLSRNVTSRMFCAGLEEGGKDSCQGDSGGPAVVDSLLAGVTSYGFGCARPNAPGVYTRIGQVYIWLYIYFMTFL